MGCNVFLKNNLKNLAIKIDSWMDDVDKLPLRNLDKQMIYRKMSIYALVLYDILKYGVSMIVHVVSFYRNVDKRSVDEHNHEYV